MWKNISRTMPEHTRILRTIRSVSDWPIKRRAFAISRFRYAANATDPHTNKAVNGN